MAGISELIERWEKERERKKQRRMAELLGDTEYKFQNAPKVGYKDYDMETINYINDPQLTRPEGAQVPGGILGGMYVTPEDSVIGNPSYTNITTPEGKTVPIEGKAGNAYMFGSNALESGDNTPPHEIRHKLYPHLTEEQNRFADVLTALDDKEYRANRNSWGEYKRDPYEAADKKSAGLRGSAAEYKLLDTLKNKPSRSNPDLTTAQYLYGEIFGDTPEQADKRTERMSWNKSPGEIEKILADVLVEERQDEEWARSKRMSKSLRGFADSFGGDEQYGTYLDPSKDEALLIGTGNDQGQEIKVVYDSGNDTWRVLD